jgi:hypothetical protein
MDMMVRIAEVLVLNAMVASGTKPSDLDAANNKSQR